MKSKNAVNQGKSKSQALFDSGNDYQHNAYLSKLHDDWDLRAEGFRQAAEQLIDGWPDFSFPQRNMLIFPILSNFRTYIELTLKDLASQHRKAINGAAAIQNTHDLMTLWDPCRQLIHRRNLPIDHAEILRIEGYLKEFHAIDPNSEAFRYPVRKDGTPSIPSSLSSINLSNLQMAMYDIADLLDKVANFLGVDVDFDREFRPELYL